MDIQKHATHIVVKLTKEGYTAYFAGGWVRDYIMQHPSSDIDIATNAPPEKILDLFPHTLIVGLAFGVVVVIIEGHQFEVSTFRRDLAYEDGRKPREIELSDPLQDSLRRDFTINGMFYDPLEERILDFVGGMEDIKKRVIKTIGDPQERFREDRLRMIRAVRFAARFGFNIDQDTQQGIIENADTLLPAVAMERIWQEFNKMTAYKNFGHALVEMHRFGLLQVVFPALQNTHLRTIKHQVEVFASFPSECPTVLYLMELFPEAPLEAQLDLCRYLRMSGHEAKLAEYCFRLRRLVLVEGSQRIDPVALSHALGHSHSQMCLEVIAARLPAEERTEWLDNMERKRFSLAGHIDRIQRKKPLVSALHLKDLGVLPGKEMGRLLKEAEKIAITYDLNDAEPVLQMLKNRRVL